jgi:hypothetical protein
MRIIEGPEVFGNCSINSSYLSRLRCEICLTKATALDERVIYDTVSSYLIIYATVLRDGSSLRALVSLGANRGLRSSGR